MFSTRGRTGGGTGLPPSRAGSCEQHPWRVGAWKTGGHVRPSPREPLGSPRVSSTERVFTAIREPFRVEAPVWSVGPLIKSLDREIVPENKTACRCLSPVA